MKRGLLSDQFMKFTVFAVMILSSYCFPVVSYTEQELEEPENVYYGIDNAGVILKNIDFQDVKVSGTWAKEAICQIGALDIIKGYGDRTFGRTNQLSKEQALAIILRAAGMEADAQLAAEELDNARENEMKKTYAPVMWSDGYLQLATDLGLISQQDLAGALGMNEGENAPKSSFVRGASAQRQDVAYWLALALGLEPFYGQQKIFNSFNDWTAADPHKVPYIEAVLRNNIMNGEEGGYFKPSGYITREQMAQVIKNAFPIIAQKLGYEIKVGTIEEIIKANDYINGTQTVTTTFNVRNSTGKLHELITRATDYGFEGYKNELKGNSVKRPDLDFIVYNGWIGNSSLLKEGDRIEYITSQDDRVRFVKVIANTGDTSYIVARIQKVDTANSTLTLSRIYDIDYPKEDVENLDFSFDKRGKDVNTTLVYSNKAEVIVDGKRVGVSGMPSGRDAVIAIRGNIVEAVKTIDLRLKEKGIVSGVVEDNNPQLGYITLLNEENNPGDNLRNFISIYNYLNPNNVTVIKNGKSTGIEAVEEGDSVFIKLDDQGNIEKISAVDNYTLKYGKVISKKPLSLSVKYDDGGYQLFEINENIPVILDGTAVGFNDLKDGDRVRMLINATGNSTELKQITIEGSEHFITNIYKGTVRSIDNIMGKLIVQNLEVLKNGKWLRTDQNGLKTVRLAEEGTIIKNNREIDIDSDKSLIMNCEAYIAVEKDYGGEEKAVLVTVKNNDDVEEPVIDDSISSNTSGNAGSFKLNKSYKNISIGNGTIIVKNSRLVSGNSIGAGEQAYVVANRDYNGDYYASVVEINERSDPDFFKIYRARISAVNEYKDFTVYSFSELSGQKWEFYNTPKTFRLTGNTQILDENGVVGQRNFTDMGDAGYKERTVYVVAKGPDAELISTVPYGNIKVKGEVYEIIGGNGEQGPAGIKLVNTKTYNNSDYIWEDSKDMSLNILANSIILKSNRIVKPSELEKGDNVRIIKKDTGITGDAYIIFAE